MAIHGILFDKDGTLLDYAATWMPANRAAALAAARGDADLCERLLHIGGYDRGTGRIAGNAVLAAGNTLEIAATWHAHAADWELAALVEAIDDIFQTQGRTSSVPVPDLAPTLNRLKARGLALGIATSDSAAGIEATLGRFDVLGHFDFFAGYDSGHGVKPEPGMVHAFCDKTGLSAREIAVVGDNRHDLDMGRAAGVGLLVAVLTGTGERADLESLADHVLDSIADLECVLNQVR